MSYEIVNEVEIDFGGKKNQIWLILIRDNDSYCVEINTYYEPVGKLLPRNKEIAERIICELERKLKTCNDLYTACNLLDLGMLMPNIDETMFIVLVTHRKYAFNEITDLKFYIGFSTYPLYEHIVLTDEAFGNRIDIFFSNKERSIGYWLYTPDEKFVFVYNRDYLK
ncbi:MAG TPA: hypothetical protein VNZ49_09645 [Bacteroidia bacterium]|nr:hypothetical protein [Bacteroidia bacterium]